MIQSVIASLFALTISAGVEQGATLGVMFRVSLGSSGEVVNCSMIEAINESTGRADPSAHVSKAFINSACRELSKETWFGDGESKGYASCFLVASEPDTPRYCLANLGIRL
jgi:hypothetical protein